MVNYDGSNSIQCAFAFAILNIWEFNFFYVVLKEGNLNKIWLMHLFVVFMQWSPKWSVGRIFLCVFLFSLPSVNIFAYLRMCVVLSSTIIQPSLRLAAPLPRRRSIADRLQRHRTALLNVSSYMDKQDFQYNSLIIPKPMIHGYISGKFSATPRG